MGLIVKFPMECCPFGQQTNIGTILQSAIFLSGFFMIFHIYFPEKKLTCNIHL